MIPLYDDNPTTRTPYLTIGLIAACVLVFIWQAQLSARQELIAVHAFGFIPAVLFDTAQLPPQAALIPAEATLVTSMFLHGGFMHLAGNMIYLWVFGNNIEDVCGHGRFLAFYLLCGLAAAFAQAVADPDSVIPMIGASGAISGVLGAYLVLFPHARVYVLIPFFIMFMYYLPAKWLLGFWFVFQLLSGLGADPEQGGVAFWAHIGGFVAGMGLIFLFRDRKWVQRTRRRARSRIPPTWVRNRTRGPWG
jgi:membrane associated rhomboid family serine protease